MCVRPIIHLCVFVLDENVPLTELALGHSVDSVDGRVFRTKGRAIVCTSFSRGGIDGTAEADKPVVPCMIISWVGGYCTLNK